MTRERGEVSLGRVELMVATGASEVESDVGVKLSPSALLSDAQEKLSQDVFDQA